MEISLDGQTWLIGEQLGSGGFGTVREASNKKVLRSVAKFVPITPGAEREVFIAESLKAAALEHVIPILDSGSVEDEYVLIMPRAEGSLQDLLRSGKPALDVAVRILRDIAQGLSEVHGAGLVHRDVKPANVLNHEGVWKLCDFGIARYQDATTDVATRKLSMTRPYAAPEQWREERATAKTDVYAFGVMAYQLVTGSLPFTGPDFRDQHLHSAAPPMSEGTDRLRTIVSECLSKAPGARPSALDLVERLLTAGVSPEGSGARQLALIASQVAQTQATEEALRQRELSAEQARAELAQSAQEALNRIGLELSSAIAANCPSGTVRVPASGDAATPITAVLADASLELSAPSAASDWSGPFDVVAEARITVQQRPGEWDRYRGRSHSLWYCDAQEAGSFSWFELGFWNPATHGDFVPESASASDFGVSELFGGVSFGGLQLARPMERLDSSSLTAFVDRWLSYLAQAVAHQLSQPMMLPEGHPFGSFRRS